MKRFFRKDPPPGWEPPLVTAQRATDEAFERFQAKLRERSLIYADVAAIRSTDSRTATAFHPTDSIPWTSARHDLLDGTITLRDAKGNEQILP